MTTHTHFDPSMTDGQVEDAFAGVAIDLGYTINPESFGEHEPYWQKDDNDTRIWVVACDACARRHISLTVSWANGEAETDLLEHFYELVALAERLRSFT